MPYKTILLHLNDHHRVASLVDTATFLATQEKAHLIGLFVMPPVKVFGSSGYGTGLIKGYLQTIRAEAEKIREVFESACRGRAFVVEWRMVDADDRSIADAVIEHGRSADLIIASQRDPDANLGLTIDEPERLAIESGRPVLFVPFAGKVSTVGKRVLVAWNGRREAARAVFDALPLLKRAGHVRILWINPQKEMRPAGDVPTAEIAASLARHGVKCEAASTIARDMDVAKTLLSSVADEGADLLVMGAYGHSRIREFVLGGATRDVLAHMTVPVLMSH
jgi:nucleotide-binding universal stress UspA family protein